MHCPPKLTWVAVQLGSTLTQDGNELPTPSAWASAAHMSICLCVHNCSSLSLVGWLGLWSKVKHVHTLVGSLLQKPLLDHLNGECYSLSQAFCSLLTPTLSMLPLPLLISQVLRLIVA